MSNCTHNKIYLPDAQYALVCALGTDCVDYVSPEQLSNFTYPEQLTEAPIVVVPVQVGTGSKVHYGFLANNLDTVCGAGNAGRRPRSPRFEVSAPVDCTGCLKF